MHGHWARAGGSTLAALSLALVCGEAYSSLRGEGAERGGSQAEKRENKLQDREGGTKMDSTLFKVPGTLPGLEGET